MNGIERYSKYISITEHVIVGSLALAALNILVQDGVSGLSRDFVRFLRKLPAVNSIIRLVLAGEVKGAMKLLANENGDKKAESDIGVIEIPEKSVSAEMIMSKLKYMYSTEK
eukprot:gene29936-33788_t